MNCKGNDGRAGVVIVWEARGARIRTRLGGGIGVLKESKRLIEVEHIDS